LFLKRLVYEDLYSLFHLYKDNYSYIFSNIAINTLTESVKISSYESSFFFFFLFILFVWFSNFNRQHNTQRIISSWISRKSVLKCKNRWMMLSRKTVSQLLSSSNCDRLIYLISSNKRFKFLRWRNKLFNLLKLRKAGQW